MTAVEVAAETGRVVRTIQAYTWPAGSRHALEPPPVLVEAMEARAAAVDSALRQNPLPVLKAARSKAS